MQRDHEWVRHKLAQIEEKRDILRSLEETLSKWQADVDWADLSPEKQAALMALAEESVGTLTAMIEQLGREICEQVDDMAGSNGEQQADD